MIVHCTCRYQESPWLSNLDWTVKNARNRLSTKESEALDAAIEKIEDFYERNGQLFCDDSGEKEADEKGLNVEEEEELERVLSSLNDGRSRSVHMPGYPE